MSFDPFYPETFFSGFMNYLRLPSQSSNKVSERDILLHVLFAESDVSPADDESFPLWHNINTFFNYLCKNKFYSCAFEFMVYLYYNFPEYTDSPEEFGKEHSLLKSRISGLERILQKDLAEKAEAVTDLLHNAVNKLKATPASCIRNDLILAAEAGVIWDCGSFKDEIDPETAFAAADADELASKSGEKYFAAALLSLFRHETTRIETDINVCLYIAEKMMEYFDSRSWADKGNICMRLIYAEYMTFFRYFVSSRQLIAMQYDLSLNIDDKEISDEAFLSACKGSDFIFSYDGISIFGERKKLARLFYSVTEKSYDAMGSYSKDIGFDLRSWSVLATVYMLWCAGERELCEVYLVRNFSRLSYSARNYIFIHVMIVRCILCSENISNIDILYGYFRYEANLAPIEKNNYIGLLSEAADLLGKARRCIENADAECYALLYGNGEFEKLENELAEHCASGSLIGHGLWKKLFEAVNTLACPTIKPGGLNQNGAWGDAVWDKKELWVILPGSLRARFDNDLRPLVARYKSVVQSLLLIDVKNEVNGMLSEHIQEMLGREAINYTEIIEEIKQQTQQEIESKEAEAAELEKKIEELESKLNDTDSEKNQIEAELCGARKKIKEYEDSILDLLGENAFKMYKAGTSLKKCVSDLYDTMNINRTGDLRQEILDFGIDFTKRYCNSEGRDLTEKMDIADRCRGCDPETKNDVIDDIITSMVVYEHLSSISDSDGIVRRKDGTETKLDFSAAVISMTKALEEVINNCVFKRLDKNKILGARDNRYYLNISRTDVKDSIELGSCAFLFDESRFRDDNFDVGQCVDHLLLKNLADSGIKLLAKDRDNHYESSFDPSDDTFNLKLLKDALYYISQDHRNRAAHPGQSITKSDFEVCRDMIVQARYLLWIILYILK